MSPVQHRRVASNGIQMHVAEQGSGPLVLLCHGFPETSWSWRRQMQPLAEAGFHVVAPDMRGYGETDRPDDVDQYSLFHLVGDMVGLVEAFGAEQAVIVGHDWGAPVAWSAAVMRPDLFRAVAALSVPYPPRSLVKPSTVAPRTEDAVFYQTYFQMPGLAEVEFQRDVRRTLAAIMTGAFSGDDDAPAPAMVRPADGLLAGVQPAAELPSWLPEAEFAPFVAAFEASGFLGGLNWYRNIDRNWELMAPFKGARVSVPALYMAGDRDLVLSFPGMRAAVEAMKHRAPQLRESLILPGCGHWTQQERPDGVNAALIRFLKGL
jgi:pimeloyl-ACP methyl ester carboxylesterase